MKGINRTLPIVDGGIRPKNIITFASDLVGIARCFAVGNSEISEGYSHSIQNIRVVSIFWP